LLVDGEFGRADGDGNADLPEGSGWNGQNQKREQETDDTHGSPLA
jgi:hypothetical protein